jgi:hypothetical protein
MKTTPKCPTWRCGDADQDLRCKGFIGRYQWWSCPECGYETGLDLATLEFVDI